jgi:hypothetical protein
VSVSPFTDFDTSTFFCDSAACIAGVPWSATVAVFTVPVWAAAVATNVLAISAIINLFMTFPLWQLREHA